MKLLPPTLHCAALAAMLMAAAAPGAETHASPDTRPNVLFIAIDDLRP